MRMRFPRLPGKAVTERWPMYVVGQYFQVWPSSPGASVVSHNANVAYIGFANTDNAEQKLKLVGFSSSGQAALRERVQWMRSQGRLVGVSLGGEGYNVSLVDPVKQALAVLEISDSLGGIDFIDFDIERYPRDYVDDETWADQHVEFCTQVRALLGQYFCFTIAPGGQTIDSYYRIGSVLQEKGLLSQFGHQFYWWNISSVDVVVKSIERAVRMGIPADRLAVGMMLGDRPKFWTQETAVEWMRIVSERCGVTKTYLWEAALPGSDEWASNMRGVLPWR